MLLGGMPLQEHQQDTERLPPLRAALAPPLRAALAPLLRAALEHRLPGAAADCGEEGSLQQRLEGLASTLHRLCSRPGLARVGSVAVLPPAGSARVPAGLAQVPAGLVLRVPPLGGTITHPQAIRTICKPGPKGHR